jgi:hypothetical protein
MSIQTWVLLTPVTPSSVTSLPLCYHYVVELIVRVHDHTVKNRQQHPPFFKKLHDRWYQGSETITSRVVLPHLVDTIDLKRV